MSQDSDCKSRVCVLARKREITGEPLNPRLRILAPNWRKITGIDCSVHMFLSIKSSKAIVFAVKLKCMYNMRETDQHKIEPLNSDVNVV